MKNSKLAKCKKVPTYEKDVDIFHKKDKNKEIDFGRLSKLDKEELKSYDKEETTKECHCSQCTCESSDLCNECTNCTCANDYEPDDEIIEEDIIFDLMDQDSKA
ncbi:hypothetical protein GE118_01600 [Mycoplasma sp. NEAQ87857]|uniref:hypothetical protein n=1 Tax=Mycoplasma sp. NEAQ87857 TaxID=2683967 RepID=UPI0013182E1D|nr:hypothetical protein [Mycoplasma sp. NEAQ87857]QGZ97490.1 hypothetical protein GE118_01600 [Mycoplasma sp. NEAQ87857]